MSAKMNWDKPARRQEVVRLTGLPPSRLGIAPYQLGEMEDLGYSPSTRMPEKRAARIIKRLQLLETTRSEIDDCAMAGTLDQRRGRLASMRQHLERNYEAACARTTELSLTDGECRHDLKALASARQNLLHAILEAELAAEMSP